MPYNFQQHLEKLKKLASHPLVNLLIAFLLGALTFEIETKGYGPFEVALPGGSFFYFLRPVYQTLLITIPVFCVINRAKDDFPKILRFSWLFLAINIALLCCYWIAIFIISKHLSSYKENPNLFIFIKYLVQSPLLISALLTFINITNLTRVFTKYWKTWIISLLFGAIFVNTFPTAQQLWKPLSSSVGSTVTFLLKFTTSETFFEPSTYTLAAGSFVIRIMEPCSGVEGISLFVILFTALIIMDWKIIKKLRALLLYCTGIVMMYLANVTRIYLLALLGYIIAKTRGTEAAYEIVAKQFHSHIGWILYTVVILLFVKFTYPFLINTKKAQEKSAA